MRKIYEGRKRNNVSWSQARNLPSYGRELPACCGLAQRLVGSASLPRGVTELGQQDVDWTDLRFELKQVRLGIQFAIVEIENGATFGSKQIPGIVEARASDPDSLARSNGENLTIRDLVDCKALRAQICRYPAIGSFLKQDTRVTIRQRLEEGNGEMIRMFVRKPDMGRVCRRSDHSRIRTDQIPSVIERRARIPRITRDTRGVRDNLHRSMIDEFDTHQHAPEENFGTL